MDFLDQLKNGVFAELLARFSAAIPKLTFALMVMLIGWLIAKGIRKIIRRVLSGLGLDRLAERLNDIDIVQRSGMRIEVSSVLSQMVYYLLMLGFVIFATDILGIPAITQMVRDLVDYIPALFSAFILLLLGLFLAEMVRGIALTTCQSMGLPSAKVISTAIFYFLFITVAISALAQAKINTGFMALNLSIIIGALALAFAVGYGIASRDLLSNYLASGYNRNKVQVGDDIRIIGMRGKVIMIDATSLTLQTDKSEIIIPLSKLATEKVEVFYPDGQEENLLEPGE
ncbi:MAG: mechanosensitive ion channel [Saprospiraceae bacterium]|nr:mechanosensitive ion channel [Saprospiraceae bacterium]